MNKLEMSSNPKRSYRNAMAVGFAEGFALGGPLPFMKTKLIVSLVAGGVGALAGAAIEYIGRLKNVDVTVGDQTITNVPAIEAPDAMLKIAKMRREMNQMQPEPMPV